MESFLNTLSTGHFSVTVLIMVIALLGTIYIIYVIPKLKKFDDMAQEVEAKQASLDACQKKLDHANELIQEYVDNAKIHNEINEILLTCRETQSAVAALVRASEKDFSHICRSLDDIVRSVESMYDKLDRESHDQFSRVDSNLRVLSSQIMDINQRLTVVSSVLSGNGSRSMDFMLNNYSAYNERDLK